MVAPVFFARAAGRFRHRVGKLGLRFAAVLGATVLLITGLIAADLRSGDSAQAASTVVLTIAPDSSTVTPGGFITVSALIRNTAKSAIKAGTLSVRTSVGVLRSSNDLTQFSAGKSEESAPITEVPSPAVAGKSSAIVTARFPASALASLSAWGARGLAGRLTIGGKSIATGRSTVVLLAGKAPSVVKVATIVPLVSTPSALGLMTADQLSAASAPEGYLTQMLTATATRSVTLAVDPRLTTSILALGPAVPSSAKTWLESLNASRAPGFWLSYGDSDLSGQVQAGAPEPVSPSIDDVPNLPSPPAGTQWGGSTWPGWNPSLTRIGWPAAGTVSDKSLAVIGSLGYSRLLLSSTNLAGATPASSSVTVSGSPSVVINQAASACASALQTDADSIVSSHDEACVAAQLAVASTSSQGATNVVIALSRAAQNAFSANGFERALNATSRLPFAAATTLSAVAASSTSVTSLASSVESSSRLRVLKQALANQRAIVTFAAVADEQNRVVNPGARRLAAFASNQWLSNPGWSTATVENQALTQEVLTSVSIVTSSTINMVGGQARIPVVLRNELPSAVTVIVRAIPSNGRLVVEQNVSLTIQAESQNRAYIPVSARIGSGRVDLEVSTTDLAGNPVGTVTLLPVNVRADWEGWGLIGLSVIFFGLLVAGVIRTLRRRRVARGGTDV